MKKLLKNFLIILILVITCLEVVLPKNVHAGLDYKEERDEGTYIRDFSGQIRFIPSSTGWHRISSYQQAAKVYYYNNKGEEKEPTKRDWKWAQNLSLSSFTIGFGRDYYMTAGTVYYVDGTSIGLGTTFTKVYANILEALEAMMAKMFYSLANGLHYLTAKALGEVITIDDVVFNHYTETGISYFESNKGLKSSLITGKGTISGLDEAVSHWYGLFFNMALMGYMVILVYMGVKIMLHSTAERMSEYKKLFTDWIIGVAILFLFPYAMAYMINLNDAFVGTIESSNPNSDMGSSGLINEDYDKKLVDVYIDDEIDWSTGTDYMSQIAFTAYQSEKLAFSFAFLILTWQLITLVFYYYKRLFMIAFLIVIFPLVALSYAIDKIADGKSQAFNRWAKEYMINVFVQSFHAIVYVFVCTTVYATSGSGTGKCDFILVIVGTTFLFKGEEIIRKIFGQVSESQTMGSLSQTAAATYAKFKLAEKAIKGTYAHTIGQKSPVRKIAAGAKSLRALNLKSEAFDKLAQKPQEYNPGERLEHMPERPPADASDDVKAEYNKRRKENLKYFNAAAVLNNPNSHSYEEKAHAEKILKDLAMENPDHDVFKDTKTTLGQFQAMAAMDGNVQNMLMGGTSRVDIERNVIARLGFIFQDDSDEQIRQRANVYFTDMYLNGGNSNVALKDIKHEIKEVIREVDDIQDSLSFEDRAMYRQSVSEDKRRELRNRTEEEAKEEARRIYEDYETDGMSDEQKTDAQRFAESLSILNKRNSGVYRKTEILRATQFVRQHIGDNETMEKMADEEFGMDIDVFAHSLARKIADEPERTFETEEDTRENTQARSVAERMVREYEDNSREGYLDDQISVHEVIKEMKDRERLNEISDKIYSVRRNAVSSITSEMAKELLTDRRIDITEGSSDSTTMTLEGKTKEEIDAEKWNVIGNTLLNFVPYGKTRNVDEEGGSGFIFDTISKAEMMEADAKRRGISLKFSERLSALNGSKSTTEYIGERREERDRIDRAHFLGDIDDTRNKKE